MSLPALPPDLRARVLDAARREPAPSRPSGLRRRGVTLVVGFAFAVASTVACAVLLGPPAIAPRPLGYFALVAVAWAAIALVASWVAVGRGRSMLGRPIAQRAAIAMVTPIALIAVATAGSALWPQTIDGNSSLLAHVICGALTLLFALGPLVAFAVVNRRTDPIAPSLTGAALGAAAGAWGALGIELFCTRATPVHIFLGHVVPVAVLVAVGAFVGQRLLGVVAVRTRTG
jgi:hypothetical protein